MPIEDQAHRSPCAQLQVLESKVNDLDRRFDEHSRVQNAHLVTIASKLDGLAKANTDGRVERSKQIGRLETKVADKFTSLFKWGLGVVLPIAAGLLYLVLNQALKP